MMDEYNYGPLEHEMAGGTHAEGWCDDCHGYAHAPWCPSYKQPSHEQPASATGSEQRKWGIDPYSSCEVVELDYAPPHLADRIAQTYGDNKEQRSQRATQIVNDHNQHQQCATQLQFLANRAEELSSLLAGMTTERDGLREVLRDVGIRLHGLQLHLTAGADGGDIASDIRGIRDEILHALNHAEQGEGSVDA